MKGRLLVLAMVVAALLVALSFRPAVAQDPYETKVTPSVSQADIAESVGMDPFTGQTAESRIISSGALESGPGAPVEAAAPKAAAPKAAAPAALPKSGGVSTSSLSMLTLGIAATVLIVSS